MIGQREELREEFPQTPPSCPPSSPLEQNDRTKTDLSDWLKMEDVEVSLYLKKI
jgi:hypothetical protein